MFWPCTKPIDLEIIHPQENQTSTSSNQKNQHILQKSIDKSDSSAYIPLTLGAGVLAACGVVSLIVGALALASIIALLTMPTGIGLAVGGALALGAGAAGLLFFGGRAKYREGSPLINPISN